MKQEHAEKQIEKLKKSVHRYMKSNKWEYDERNDVFRVTLRVQCRPGACTAYIHCRREGLFCTIAHPFFVARERYAPVIDFITRVNFCLTWGAFEFDYEESEVRIRLFLPAFDRIPKQTEIDTAVCLLVKLMEDFGEDLANAIMGSDADQTDGETNTSETSES